MIKICSRCKEAKEHFEFYKRSKIVIWRNSWCKKCLLTYSKDKYDKDIHSGRWLKRKYNLSKEEFQNLSDSQNNLCKICGNVFKETPCVDHCHTTNKVRGLLCSNCNKGIGFFKENTDYLNSAIKYINDTQNKTPE